METISAELGGREITIETGHMARQASGSVVVRYGDTMVLVTMVWPWARQWRWKGNFWDFAQSKC